MPRITTSCKTEKPLLDIKMISHGTLSSFNLQESRRFYEEVLGLDVIQVSPVSLLIRKGTHHTYAVVETGEPSTMSLLDHNGIDVGSAEEVREAHKLLTETKEEYGTKRINKIMHQHGAYSFYFEDLDGNWWELIHGRDSGYSYILDEGRDMTGRTDVDPDGMGHVLDEDFPVTAPADA